MSRSWNGGKNARSDKELNKIQRLAHENKKLKQEIGRLKKLLNRLDSGWCNGCIKKYEESPQENGLPEPTLANPPIKDRTCFRCKEGKLRIVKYYKVDQEYYFRACDMPGCGHRTRGKKLTPEVQED